MICDSLSIQIQFCLDTSTENHPIFSAFLFAYNSHEDIVLSPDDIWLLICIYFSQYVNEHAEQLRALFVDHDGRKTLTIEQVGLLDPKLVYYIFNIDGIMCVLLVGLIFFDVCKLKYVKMSRTM